MRKIGFIHRYSNIEEMGILVYGHEKFGQQGYISPILFTKNQCKNIVRTGQLVYFNIEDDGTINNIEPASIYNFERDLVWSYVAGYGSKDWYECERNTHICYQNIAELSELVSEETEFQKSEIEDVEHDDDHLSLVDEDEFLELGEIDNSFDKDDKKTLKSPGHYQKIDIPDSIVEEYKLFGRCFINEYSDFVIFDEEEIETHNITIDILDPSLWIPAKLHSIKTYYGGNATELKDLIDIISNKRRDALGRHLDNMRYRRNDGFWKLSLNIQNNYIPNYS